MKSLTIQINGDTLDDILEALDKIRTQVSIGAKTGQLRNGLSVGYTFNVSQEPFHFETLEEFVEALNAYDGGDIWNDLIWGVFIEGPHINDCRIYLDNDKCSEGNGLTIYFRDGRKVLYSEEGKTWYVWNGINSVGK